MSELNLDQGAVELASVSIETKDGLSGADRVEQEVAYWRQKLVGIPAVLELPTDRPRLPVQTFRAARESVIFPKGLKRALDGLSEQEDISLFVLLLTAFQALLTRYTRQDDIVVGVEMPGCDVDDARDANQHFCTVPIRTDISGDPAFRQLLSRVNNNVRSAGEHQNVPWERVVEAVQPDRDASRHRV